MRKQEGFTGDKKKWAKEILIDVIIMLVFGVVVSGLISLNYNLLARICSYQHSFFSSIDLFDSENYN